MSESTNPIRAVGAPVPTGPSPGARAAPRLTEKTALCFLVEDARQLGPLMDFLTVMAARRGARGADGQDAIGATLVRAFAREAKGEVWDPKKCDVRLHLLHILEGELTNKRRTRKRRPTEAIGEGESEPDAGDELTLEDDLVIARERERRSDELLALCKEESDGGLGWGIFGLARRGIGDHDEVAEHLKCSVSAVRAARKRLDRRIAKVRGS